MNQPVYGGGGVFLYSVYLYKTKKKTTSNECIDCNRYYQQVNINLIKDISDDSRIVLCIRDLLLENKTTQNKTILTKEIDTDFK